MRDANIDQAKSHSSIKEVFWETHCGTKKRERKYAGKAKNTGNKTLRFELDNPTSLTRGEFVHVRMYLNIRARRDVVISAGEFMERPAYANAMYALKIYGNTRLQRISVVSNLDSNQVQPMVAPRLVLTN